MSSNWFDFDESLTSEFLDKTKIEYLKKNIELNTKKIHKAENWSTTNDVNEILDLASEKISGHSRSKLLNSLLKDRVTGRKLISRTPRFSEESFRMRNLYTDDFFSDVDEKVRKIKNKYVSDRYETESQRSNEKERNESKFETRESRAEKSSSGTSANSYGFTEVISDGKSRKNSFDSTWSRKSNQGQVNFPSSSISTLAESCGEYSTKTIGRSVSRDSDDSACTEKSINSSAVSEKLPDGTDKTQIENNEYWLKKSTSESKIAEKKFNDTKVTEKHDDGICEKSTTRMSYLEKSATGSSLQEEMTSEKVTSSSKGKIKTMEQKTSSETFKKSHRMTPNKSAYYDDLDSCSFERFSPPYFSDTCSYDRNKTPTFRKKEFFTPSRATMTSEKISKLIDEAVYQDDLFKIPSSLQTDIEKVTDDFFNSKTFGRDRTRTNKRRLSGLLLGANKEETSFVSSKLSELTLENDSLRQENSKLQSIIQDVTAVNKRWQKYNNERHLYVQKLLSTIQDLQEQINLISEKSAFQSKSKEEISTQHSELEKLKKEHQEHTAILELQIKSHKEDWDTERREKRKALQEKEELEEKLLELTRDVKLLKEVLQEERQIKKKVCMMCKNNYDQNEVFQNLEFFPPAASHSAPNYPASNFCATVHIPYNTVNQKCFYTNESPINTHINSPEQSPYFLSVRKNLGETFLNERFSRTTKNKNSLASDTIVVEDESGIRLAITEQFPSKDGSLKSILKKGDKKNKLFKQFPKQLESNEESKCSRNLILCSGRPSITCEECDSEDSSTSGLTTIRYPNEELSQVKSFSPDSVTLNNATRYLSIKTPQHLRAGGEISRSRSEPNTRSNSSENLRPLRESSSWNSESFSADANVKENFICPSCDIAFPSSIHPTFLDHFEICQTKNNQF